MKKPTGLEKAILKNLREGKAEGARAARIEAAKKAGIRHCKVCGCSEFDPCFDADLQDGCAWVSRNECSVCRPDLLHAKLKKAGLA